MAPSSTPFLRVSNADISQGLIVDREIEVCSTADLTSAFIGGDVVSPYIWRFDFGAASRLELSIFRKLDTKLLATSITPRHVKPVLNFPTAHYVELPHFIC